MADRTQKSIALIDAAPRYMPLSGFQKYVDCCLEPRSDNFTERASID